MAWEEGKESTSPSVCITGRLKAKAPLHIVSSVSMEGALYLICYDEILLAADRKRCRRV
jgi:hypothetical protein